MNYADSSEKIMNYNEKIFEAISILKAMRKNCIKKETDKYDDMDREAKYEALGIALNCLERNICFDL